MWWRLDNSDAIINWNGRFETGNQSGLMFLKHLLSFYLEDVLQQSQREVHGLIVHENNVETALVLTQVGLNILVQKSN